MDARRPASRLAWLDWLGLNALARLRNRRRLLVLRYAGLRADDAETGPDDPRLPVSALRQQLAHLKAKGYRLVSLDELLTKLSHPRRPARMVTLTLDGGLLSAVALAYPLLRELGARGTLYVSPGLVAAGADAAGEPTASWDELRGLDPAVLLVGNQGRSPADCLELSTAAEFEREIWQAGLDIEEKLGYPVRHFCCPAQDEDLLPPRVPARLADYGYRSAVTARQGFADQGQDAFHLFRVEASADFHRFKAATSGALAWLEALGLVKKREAPVPAGAGKPRARAAAAGGEGRPGG